VGSYIKIDISDTKNTPENDTMTNAANTIDITNYNDAELDALLGIDVAEDAPYAVHGAYLRGFEARMKAVENDGEEITTDYTNLPVIAPFEDDNLPDPFELLLADATAAAR
jgi:hypothetical protein